ncbi:MAG: nuclear transport factor 2 family protein [Labilithrix sp.]|nr:nuclear transport factor 2 family protein [Labilithrix sp.]MCW5818016.1 nuclear transport factor 2 family protein [Labilithrix sp.]
MRFLLVFTCLAAVGCARPAAPSAPPPAAPAITQLLDDWHDAASKADEERYFGHFANGAVFMGTDATERWTLPQFRAYAHPHFAKGKAWSFRAIRRDISFVGDVAWFDEDLDTPNLGPARGSGVLVREPGPRDEGTWKIAHYNLSITVPNERMKEVKALIATPPAP